MAKLVTKKEYKKRRVRFQIAAGLADFIVTLSCLALVFICILLVTELINWLRNDAETSLGLFERIIRQVLRTNGTASTGGIYR